MSKLNVDWREIKNDYPAQFRQWEVWLGCQYALADWELINEIGFYSVPVEMQIGVVYRFFEEKGWQVPPADVSYRPEVIQGIADSFAIRYMDQIAKQINFTENESMDKEPG